VRKLPLMMAPVGQEHTIIECNIEHKLKKHLETLGILPGEKITPISSRAGDLIIRVRDSRLAINMGLASKIFVS